MAIVTLDQLKAYLKNGEFPDETKWEDLIDTWAE